jgi:hypothetical protein
MLNALKQEGDPRVIGDGDIFDRYPYANHRERNFYRKYTTDAKSVRAGWVNQTDFEPASLPLSPIPAAGKNETPKKGTAEKTD